MRVHGDMELKNITELRENGFCVFRNIINNSTVENIQKHIHQNDVNYEACEIHMNNILSKIPGNLKMSKYRISNNNNSTDAAAFHRDIICTEPQNPPNIYTTLHYLDTSVMELIPGSHKKLNMSYIEAAKTFRKRIRITMAPNDILIFNATVLHRGIFSNANQKNRRLIQMFDCVDESHFDLINQQTLHLPCKYACLHNFENFMINTSRIPYIIDLINYINYYNTATGYGHELEVPKKHGYDQIYLSNESNNKRLKPSYSGNEQINMYIVKEKVNDIREEDVQRFRYALNIHKNIITVLIHIYLVVLFIIIVRHVNKLMKNKKIK